MKRHLFKIHRLGGNIWHSLFSFFSSSKFLEYWGLKIESPIKPFSSLHHLTNNNFGHATYVFFFVYRQKRRLTGHNRCSNKITRNFILLCLTMCNGSPVLILALLRASLDSKGVLGLNSWISSHSSRVSILTVPWPAGAFFILRSTNSSDLESSYCNIQNQLYQLWRAIKHVMTFHSLSHFK